MAGGFTIKKENIPLFRDFLIKNFKKSKLSSSKIVNLYLDSIIAPSALNEEFYSEIERLAPFGSGNSEPKFVIENLQVITSDLVADKHIKTVLYAKDGSVIKSIAFNAKDSPLELYLNKKNKKKFNIAGIMNLMNGEEKKV